ncbi:hypothetical protein HK098_006541 [Nowakowskiella sp. JEL0407]|nr:hypothetical protein HK098_006541 [Nowakowskiella sp. JEL0407]
MANQILAHFNNPGNKDLLRDYVVNTSNEDILHAVLSAISECCTDRLLDARKHCGPVIKAILLGLDSEANDASEDEKSKFKRLRLSLTSLVINWFLESDVQDNMRNAVSNELIVIGDYFENPKFSGCIGNAIQSIIEKIKSGEPVNLKIFELLQKLIQSLNVHQELTITITDNSSTEIVDPILWKRQIIEKLCCAKWRSSVVVPLFGLFCEIDIDSSQIDQVSEKLISQLRNVESNSLGSAVRQLMVFAFKGNKKIIMEKICEEAHKIFYEDKMDVAETGMATPNEAEGQVVVQICYGIRQDDGLAKETVKLFKTFKTKPIKGFHLAFMLATGQIHRFDDVFDQLKSLVMTSFANSIRVEKTFWIRETSPFPLSPIPDLLINLVPKYSIGWESVIQSLIVLSFRLLEFDKMKGLVVCSKTADLGCELLESIFEIHENSRSFIIQELTDRVNDTSSQYVLQILHNLVEKFTNYFQTDLFSHIRETVLGFSALPQPVANSLFRATFRLVDYNPRLKDDLMLILRKAMFSRDITGQMAIDGYLQLLWIYAFKLENESSQSQPPINEPQDENIIEILDALSRCFDKFSQGRSLLYEGLLELLRNFDTMAVGIKNLVIEQFEKFYEADVAIHAPVRLEKCVESVNTGTPRLLEPLHLLMSVLCRSVLIIRAHSAEETQNQMNELVMIENVIDRFVKADTQDFELDKNADFSQTNTLGITNNLTATILKGCYEAAIEFLIMRDDYTKPICDQIIKLFKNHREVSDMLKDKKEKGKKVTTETQSATIFRIDVCKKILTFLLSDLSKNTRLQHLQTLLKSESSFEKFWLTATLSELSKIPNLAKNEVMTASYNDIQSIATTIYSAYLEPYATAAEDTTKVDLKEQKSKGKSQLLTAVDCFAMLFNIVFTKFPKNIANIIVKVFGADQSLQKVQISAFGLRKLQCILLSFIQNPMALHREALACFNFIQQFEQELNNKTLSLKIVETCKKICEQFPVSDLALIKCIVARAVQRVQGFELILQLAEEVCNQGGQVENGETPVSSFAIINQETYVEVGKTIISCVSDMLDDIDWALSQIKAHLGQTHYADANEIPQDIILYDKTIDNRLISLIRVMLLILINPLPDPATEISLKTLIKLYKTMESVAKQVNITFVQTITEEAATTAGDKKKNNNQAAQKRKVSQESKNFPQLIYGIEQLDRYLIQMAKKTKVWSD